MWESVQNLNFGNQGVKQLCKLFYCCMSHFFSFPEQFFILNFYFIPNFCIRPTNTDMDRKPLEFWGSALRYVLAASCHILSVTVVREPAVEKLILLWSRRRGNLFWNSRIEFRRKLNISCARIITLPGGGRSKDTLSSNNNGVDILFIEYLTLYKAIWLYGLTTGVVNCWPSDELDFSHC